MMLTTRTRRATRRGSKRKGKPRPNRVGIPPDPMEYEARRIHAQKAVDRHHGPGRYRVVGEPGEMLHLVHWVDCPLLAAAPKNPLQRIEGATHASHAA